MTEVRTTVNGGRVTIAEFNNGKLHGRYTESHEDGTTPRHDRVYSMGQLHGCSKIYDVNGDLIHVCIHVNGVLAGEINAFYGTPRTKTVYFISVEGQDITGDIKQDVVDIGELTKVERMLIKVKYGVDCVI